MNFNELERGLPTELGLMTNLRKFDVSDNNGITGTLPWSLKHWTVIEEIEVQQTRLEGRVPNAICETLEARPIDFQYKHVEEKSFRATCSSSTSDGVGLICRCCTECCYRNEITNVEMCEPVPPENDD